MKREKMLEGLKVIELATVLAGPAVGMFFSELGAEVIKVENRQKGGDMTRSWKLPNENAQNPVSAYFSSVNYRKQYIDLDISSEEGQAKLLALIKDADIFIDNLKPKSKMRFGLDPERLARENPKLIQASLGGFAADQGQVAFDIVLQAETGYLSMCGYPNQMAKLPVAFIDLFAAHQLKEAILIALYHRAKDGRGANIRTSLEESALASLANQASNHLMTGHLPGRLGTLHPNIAPYGEIIQSADEIQFVLAIGTQKQFEALCHVLSCKELIDRDEFRDNRQRVIYRSALHEVLKTACLKIKGQDFFQACLNQAIPVGRIKNMDEVLQSEAAKRMVLHEEIENHTTSRLCTVAFEIQRAE